MGPAMGMGSLNQDPMNQGAMNQSAFNQDLSNKMEVDYNSGFGHPESSISSSHNQNVIGDNRKMGLHRQGSLGPGQNYGSSQGYQSPMGKNFGPSPGSLGQHHDASWAMSGSINGSLNRHETHGSSK